MSQNRIRLVTPTKSAEIQVNVKRIFQITNLKKTLMIKRLTNQLLEGFSYYCCIIVMDLNDPYIVIILHQQLQLQKNFLKKSNVAANR